MLTLNRIIPWARPLLYISLGSLIAVVLPAHGGLVSPISQKASQCQEYVSTDPELGYVQTIGGYAVVGWDVSVSNNDCVGKVVSIITRLSSDNKESTAKGVLSNTTTHLVVDKPIPAEDSSDIFVYVYDDSKS